MILKNIKNYVRYDFCMENKKKINKLLAYIKSRLKTQLYIKLRVKTK
jgi:hypothetical protein